MTRYFLALLIGLALIAAGPVVSAQEARDMGGWEADGAYNKHYDMNEYDQFKGVIEEFIEVTPMPGMSPGVALVVKNQDDEMIEVHLGPEWFVRNTGLRPGDKVRVRGAWAEIEGREVFMGAKIKKGENEEYKVRLTKDGTPFWTMTAEELARERSGD